MELTLKEKFLILAYDPVKGKNLATNFISYGLAGAILMELAELNRIKIEKKRVKLTGHQRTGDHVLDNALSLIDKGSR
ncbi:MAG: GPP34 family phosphoprotein, partial [Bacteroidales bacterium]|nr:GPP34 family phosphoprotein [Bacteroidales bacterium]